MCRLSNATLNTLTNFRVELTDYLQNRYMYTSISAILIDEYNALSVVKLKDNSIFTSTPYEKAASISKSETNDIFHTARIVIVFLKQELCSNNDDRSSPPRPVSPSTTVTPDKFVLNQPVTIQLIDKNTHVRFYCHIQNKQLVYVASSECILSRPPCVIIVLLFDSDNGKTIQFRTFIKSGIDYINKSIIYYKREVRTMGNMFGTIFGKKHYRILMLGLDNAGKTSILYRLRHKEAITTIPTVGFNVETVLLGHVKFNVWDVGGQDKIRPLWRHYYTGSQGLIFVVDSCDRERIEEASHELDKIINDREMRNTVLLIFCNKQDMPDCMQPAEIRQLLHLDKLTRPYAIMSCSALQGTGLPEGLKWLSEHCK
ncbi:unnamed protein product [Adineta ricciae]|uniref:ADP-ribosylation factor n=1 Tax=Adineta ricciae TaxID=249248 RepID=A0A814AGP6_ADIRI|nr:unnamed protein product [Adineta ricciae]